MFGPQCECHFNQFCVRNPVINLKLFKWNFILFCTSVSKLFDDNTQFKKFCCHEFLQLYYEMQHVYLMCRSPQTLCNFILKSAEVMNRAQINWMEF